MFLFRANDENNMVTVKTLTKQTFKKQLSITLFSDLVFKHENIKLLIDYYYDVSNYVACFKP